MDRQALIILAGMIDKARIQANAIVATEAQDSVYGDLVKALQQTLALVDAGNADALYQSILDGNSVMEAIAAI